MTVQPSPEDQPARRSTSGVSGVAAPVKLRVLILSVTAGLQTLKLVAWFRFSSNALVSINVVTLRRAQLVLGWVTVYERVNHLGM